MPWKKCNLNLLEGEAWRRTSIEADNRGKEYPTVNFSNIIQNKLPKKQTARGRNYFRCKKVKFNTDTLQYVSSAPQIILFPNSF
jgi:hypothetical protein